MFSSFVLDHPSSRASFCLLDQGGEKQALPVSRQIFEVAAAQTSGLVILVISHKTDFFSASIRLKINRWT